jgi:DNA-binding LytR/AlgR family response regulator
LLLDDELPGLSYLKMLCEQIPQLEVIRAFDNPLQLLKEIDGFDFDICILDIEMPGLNGIQLAKLLKGKPVIFTTAYSEYAIDAFDLDAVDYLRKPLKLERLQLAVQKAIKRLKAERISKDYFQINTAKGKTLIYYTHLNFVRTNDFDSRDKSAHLINNSIILLKNISFDKLLRLLPSNQFCRINKQEIISLRCVKHFSHNLITSNINLPDGKQLVFQLSEIYRKNFIEKIKI